ncbi:site-2 protease family protein [Patescibacteria group bacterium]
MELDIIFAIIVLIMSVVVHEVSHGYAAYMLGDSTAKMAGRLTLNPVKHLDPVGSFLVPFLTYAIGGLVFGWAKPVPYNPYNLKNQKWGPAIVAFAGPASNLLLAFVFGMLIRFAVPLGIASDAFFTIATTTVLINVLLAVFNLIPIPPLDGSKILFSALPYHMRHVQEVMERYWIALVFFLLVFLWRFILPVVFFIFELITGMRF